MDGEEITMLQRSADIIKEESSDLSPEAVAAFLYIIAEERLTIAQLASALNLEASLAARTAIELSSHQSGPGLIQVDLDGDMNRLISLNEKSITFARRLGYALRS